MMNVQCNWPHRSLIIVLLCWLIILAACTQSGTDALRAPAASAGTGTLTIVANGEDFVRQGFTSKDGWSINFDQLFVTLADVTAYQSAEPFDASSGDLPQGLSVSIAGPITLDLAAGDQNAEPIVVEAITDAPAGHYNALGWRIVPAVDGDAAGFTLSLAGRAQKDGESIRFVINDATEYAYNCGEYVGDERKGVLVPGGTASLEATFHFDHLFGDAETGLDEALNVGALGFEPLAALAQDGTINITVAELANALSAEDYAKLVDTLATLGHVGEGHCYEATGGFTGHSD